MDPVAASEPLRPGDVVHHPAFGFATVTEVDDRGAQLRWAREGHSSPTHVSRHMLHTSYRRCRTGGLLARHLVDPAGVRRLAADDPVALLGLLLVDLGGSQPAADAEEWMLQLVGGDNFPGWWSAVRVLASVDERFLLDEDHFALSPGVAERDFLERPGQVAPSLPADDELTLLPPPPPPDPAAPRPAIDAPWLWGSALDLANALAALHAAGRSVLRRREAATHTYTWTLQPDEERGPAHADVHWAARRLLEDAVGIVIPEAVPSHELVDLVPAVLPGFPPELLGVLRYALARDAALRPRDGLAFAHTLTVAHAVWASRADLPHRVGAELVAGFDTHIGTLKALAGQTNQDSFLLLGDPEHALVMVADGISTATAGSGDLASALTARSLRLQWTGHQEALRGAPAAEVHRFLVSALDRANRVVADAAVRLAGGDLSRHVPMGTTVVVGVTAGDVVHLAALGDSRAWLVGRHGVAPLFWDQNLNSVRLRQAAAGAPLHWDERGYALVGYLGHFDELGDPALGPVMTTSVRLLPGEWLILASDGISDHAADEEAGVYRILERLVAEHGAGADASSAMRLARRIVLSANDGSGGDNATVLALTLSA